MTRQEQIQKIIDAVVIFQDDFESETRNFSQAQMENILCNIIVGYSLDCNCLTVDFCNGSCGVDLPYSNMRPDLFLNSAIFAKREEIEEIVEEEFAFFDAGEWED